MSKIVKLFSLTVVAASLAVPLSASAAEKINVACSVAIDYVVNGTTSDQYRKDFSVQSGVAFSDDVSTSFRQKIFNASVAREAGNLAIAIDYFADVNTFDSVNFNTRVTLHDSRGIETTSGSHTFSSSQGAQPGNHTTNYTLTCRRK
jgi:hypothetical protein